MCTWPRGATNSRRANALSLLLFAAGCSVARTAVVDTAKVGGFVVKKTAQATVKTGETVGHEMHQAVKQPSPPPPEQ